MTLIIFIHKDAAEKGDILQKVMDQKLSRIDCRILKTFSELKERLKLYSNYNDTKIFILLADSEKRLNQLTQLIDLLVDRRLILILPNDSSATTSMAHKFFPRFITYVSDTYNDLCSVLDKMTNSKKDDK